MTFKPDETIAHKDKLDYLLHTISYPVAQKKVCCVLSILSQMVCSGYTEVFVSCLAHRYF